MDAVDVVVLGLGFTGLPMAVAAAEAGHRVVGLDCSARRVMEITRARLGGGLTTVTDDALREQLSGGRLDVRTTTEPVPAARVHVVCVPTPPGLVLGADLTALFSAIDGVAASVHHGDLVLVQSTCPPGTIGGMLAPRLAAGSGLQPGSDFFLAHSPVRIDPGGGAASVRGVPRVVGGITTGCAEAATRFLTGLAERVVPVRDLGTAELTKVFENSFRLVNISLVNELAELCRASGVDVLEVLDAAGTKPYGYLRHQPGPGAGGDCVPVSAGFLAAAARQHAFAASIVEAALAVNEAMPARTVRLVREWLAERRLPPLRGRRVLVSGVTYKRDVASVRRSAAVRVLEQLGLEADVSYHDPYVPRLALGDGTVLRSRPLCPDAADLVLVLTRHRVVDVAWLADRGVQVVDCSTGQPRPLVPSAR